MRTRRSRGRNVIATTLKQLNGQADFQRGCRCNRHGEQAVALDVSVEHLAVRAPDRLAAAIFAERSEFGLVIDLGCGTGLMGERLRSRCRRLEGVDISAAMLRKAAAKQLYDRLVKADLRTFSGGPADLVTAADVLIYIGALDHSMARAADMLAEGGLLAFSVEHLSEGDGFALQPSRRYAHSESYVTAILAQCGLSLLSLEPGVLRQDRGEPVEGLIVVAAKR